MKVLVAGATGTIEGPLVRTLVAGGDRVYGLTRDPGKRQLLTVLGAEPVITDGAGGHSVAGNDLQGRGRRDG
jgi:uncharacterized protein YbjT (DUF2867 family)